MDFVNELEEMSLNYANNRRRNIYLSRPSWLYGKNALSALYKEKKRLLREGTVAYASIVQANTILFKVLPPFDCPASIVYSTDPYVAENPEILDEVACKIYSFKNVKLDQVPAQWREMARITTDERDYSSNTFTVVHEGHSIEIHFLPIMVYRKLLPRRKLIGGLLPVLTHPECESVLILPKQYWSENFKRAWVTREI